MDLMRVRARDFRCLLLKGLVCRIGVIALIWGVLM